jgi:hypothetical protein
VYACVCLARDCVCVCARSSVPSVTIPCAVVQTLGCRSCSVAACAAKFHPICGRDAGYIHYITPIRTDKFRVRRRSSSLVCVSVPWYLEDLAVGVLAVDCSGVPYVLRGTQPHDHQRRSGGCPW